jgi:hypothetical protein
MDDERLGREQSPMFEPHSLETSGIDVTGHEQPTSDLQVQVIGSPTAFEAKTREENPPISVTSDGINDSQKRKGMFLSYYVGIFC